MAAKRTSRISKTIANVPPDQMKLTARQAERLSSLSGVSVADLKGATIASLTDKLKWHIDPELLLFRRICGQVVKTDPATGLDYPVPFATVHVEDTDCSFLGFFPAEGPWGWLFPLFCHREEITTVVTDECGRFCVWIPRFDIDWILRWRRERLCYGDFFVQPTIRDLLKHYQLLPQEIIPPVGPTPDPPPFVFKAGGLSYQRLESLLGRDAALELGAAESGLRFGNKAGALSDVLNRPAFASPPLPPLPAEVRALNTKEGAKGLARHMTVSAEVFARRDLVLDLDRYIGPFLRCRDIFVAEWTPILDVPDITFRVTQDVDGDGDQETIYSEGFFDVRWNSSSIPDVTLHASAIALTSPICHTPVVDCNGLPSIQFAGLMPVNANYINPATGYGVRPNRPHPHGLFAEAPTPGNSATAPFRATMQLYGCNRHEGAQFYRMLYSYNGSASVPFTNRTWYIYPWGGGPAHHVVPDAQGWYPILANPGDWHPANLLLDWPTGQYPDGLYSVSMQLGNAAKAVVQTTASVPFRVDNSTPNGQFTSLAWRVQGSTTWTYFPNLVCPVVSRPVIGGVPQAIEFRVSYIASATHMLKTILSGSGCGGGLPDRLAAPNWSDPPTAAVDGSGLSQNPYDHWHIDAGDNTIIRSAIFSLPGARPEGAYGFNLSTYSRAFNPDGGDAADPLAADWYVDAASLIWRHSFLPVAVVNA